MYALYFAVNVRSVSPIIVKPSAMGVLVYDGTIKILLPVQMFVLGPFLILSIPDHHAKLVANSDGGSGVPTTASQGHMHSTTTDDSM